MAILYYKKFAGLHIVCKQCGRTLELTQTPYKGCNHPIKKQKYKAILRINGQRRTKDLTANEYEDAVKELIDWKQYLTSPFKIRTSETTEDVKFVLFSDCIKMFADWLENVNVPKQEQKPRSPKYVKDTVGYLIKLKTFLQKNGFKIDTLTIYDIDKYVIGTYYEHISLSTKSAASFNHNLRALKCFYNFLLGVKGYGMPNPVKTIKLKYENPDPRSIDDNDFIKLLSVVNEENSYEIYNCGSKNQQKKKRYRAFIKDSFELAAFTGMRLEELTILKYTDIVEDASGKLLYLKGTDLKFQRTHNWDSTKPPKIVYIPITPELEGLLHRLNYKQNKGVDRYLIDGDCTMARKTLVTQMSKSFTFFRKKAGLPDTFTIKHLRKTFLSKLETQTNLAQAAGYQKTASVILKNYIDKKMVVKEITNRGFAYYDTVSADS